MRISNSFVMLHSKSFYQRIAFQTSKQPLFISFTPDPYTGRHGSLPYQNIKTDSLEISQEALLTLKTEANRSHLQLEVCNHLVSSLSGQDLKLLDLRPTGLSDQEWFLLQLGESCKAKAERLQNSQDDPPKVLDSTAFYRSRESLQEKEILSFSAQGFVETADGRRIDLAATLNMSREFAVQNKIDFTMKIALFEIDGLKLYQDTVANLREESFIFNIDSKGKEDQVTSLLTLGGGFLVIDANRDGKMELQELVSAANGDAFTVFSEYDEDHNGWIDERDSIYDRLQIWIKDEQGNDRLFAIGQKGIGAICLANISSTITSAQVKRSGIYLQEDGNTGLIQQIDLWV